MFHLADKNYSTLPNHATGAICPLATPSHRQNIHSILHAQVIRLYAPHTIVCFPDMLAFPLSVLPGTRRPPPITVSGRHYRYTVP